MKKKCFPVYLEKIDTPMVCVKETNLSAAFRETHAKTQAG